jgi:hypothetical protein
VAHLSDAALHVESVPGVFRHAVHAHAEGLKVDLVAAAAVPITVSVADSLDEVSAILEVSVRTELAVVGAGGARA